MRRNPTIALALIFAAGSASLPCVAASPLPRFPANAAWNQDVSGAPKHPNSDDMLGHLATLGGWGTGATALQIDFSFKAGVGAGL